MQRFFYGECSGKEFSKIQAIITIIKNHLVKDECEVVLLRYWIGAVLKESFHVISECLVVVRTRVVNSPEQGSHVCFYKSHLHRETRTWEIRTKLKRVILIGSIESTQVIEGQTYSSWEEKLVPCDPRPRAACCAKRPAWPLLSLRTRC